MKWTVYTCGVLLLTSGVFCQEDEELSQEEKICRDKGSGELFRLATGSDKCRDVIQCTAAGLQAIRCPPGLAFDLEAQTCDWKDNVKNCNKLTMDKKPLPLLHTETAICEPNHLACADGNCIERGLFCNGVPDCQDGSDENACDGNSDPNAAPICDLSICVLPDCFCSVDGTAVPGGLCPGKKDCTKVPQMITITFDDAINNNNIELYNEIFKPSRLNPNGCDIKSTYFVSHKYTNYTAVNDMHMRGHEIAVHSISHNVDEQFWANGSVADWTNEMDGSRDIINHFANITDESVVGSRAPFLRLGGNNQFSMLEQNTFLYDSSITAPLQNPPLWPYTMYFKMPHRCHGHNQKCPTRSHAVWEMVMNELDRRESTDFSEDLSGCAMIDSCSSILSGDQFFKFLQHNFDRHYNSNRAPMGVYYHAAWLKNNQEFLNTFLYWIDLILDEYDDVYFVTMTQAIQWMQDPVEVRDAKNFSPWQHKCNPKRGDTSTCPLAKRCTLSSELLAGGETIQMHSCQRCPNRYPWLGDTRGLGLP